MEQNLLGPVLPMIRSKYEESMSLYYAAARLWLDAIIDPLDTRIPPKARDRLWISMGIEAASQSRSLGTATREPAFRRQVQHGGLADVITFVLWPSAPTCSTRRPCSAH